MSTIKNSIKLNLTYDIILTLNLSLLTGRSNYLEGVILNLNYIKTGEA